MDVQIAEAARQWEEKPGDLDSRIGRLNSEKESLLEDPRSRAQELNQIVDSLQSQVAELTEEGREKDPLVSEVAARDLRIAELLKLKGQTGNTHIRGEEIVKFELLLADAICDHFNPRYCDEIHQLLKLASSQHIELTGSVRVQIDHGYPGSSCRTLHPFCSQFNRLDSELSRLGNRVRDGDLAF
jgi:hypothetical protein